MTKPYYLKRTFRSITDEQLGQIQHLWLDLKWTQKALAKKFKVSVSLIGAACRCVPKSYMKPMLLRQVETARAARLKVRPRELIKSG